MPSYDNAFLFFYDNAGYSYDPKTQTEDEGRMECANRLALAEAFAQEAGIDFEQVDDDAENGEPRYGCRCVQLPHVALWGIDVDDSDPYWRIVKAELAAELVPWKAVKAFGESSSFRSV